MTGLGALAPIIERKRAEAAALHCGRAAMFAHAANLEHAPAIERILAGGTVLAELKRRSPSGGVLRPDLDAVAVAEAYEAAGAVAISVLTDGPDFGGSLDDLVAVRGAVEVAIAGDPSSEAFQALVRPVADRYVPSLVLVGGMGAAAQGIALLDGRVSTEAVAYLCRNHACDVPTGDAAVLAEQLDELVGREAGARAQRESSR